MLRYGVVVVALGSTLLGCGVESKPDPCAEVSCGEGRCALVEGAAACLCNPGFIAVGLSCSVLPPPDLCASNPCASLTNSLCQVNAGRVSCVCPSTRVEVNGSCVVRTACVPNPCTQAHRTTCEISGGVGVCRCDRGYAPEGDGCGETPVWTCAAQHSDGDGAEADECPTFAKPLGIGEIEQRTLFPAGDHDWFEIGVTGGHLFTVQANASGMPLLIEVFEQSGVTLLASDNRGSSAAEVTFQAPFAQTVMVRVRGVRASDTGSYTVRYTEIGVDDYVNTPSGAVTLVAGANPFTGSLQYAGDLDVVWLELPGQTAVQLTALDGGVADLVFEVARPDGGVRLLNAGERTSITVPGLESITVTARARNPRSVGAFSLAFVDLGVDDHSDEVAFATPVQTDNVPVPGRFERADDIDSFRVQQLADRLYRVRWPTASYGPQVTVVRPSGQLSAGYGYGSSGFVWQADQSAPATVRIQSSYSGTAPAYSIAVEDLGFDDHSDTLGNATPATHGVPIGGRLELADDLDTFSFTATAGRILQVSAVGTGSSSTLGLHVTVFDSFGQALTEADGAVGFVAVATGLYKAQIERGGYSSTSDLLPYVVTVSDQGVDDHSGTSSTATLLTVGTAAQGSVQFGTDVDAFAFTAISNHLYGVNCTRSSGGCSFQVKDPTGQPVLNSGSSFTFLAPVAGRWIVEVNSGSSYSPVLGAYSLTVSDLGLEDHGGTIATASPLTVGTTISGNIGFSQDLDVFSFTAQAGHIYAATASPSSVRLEVRNSTNLVVASSYSSTVSFQAPGAGTFYVVASSYSVGAYNFVVTDRGVDDHGNNAAGATPLTLGTSESGEIQFQSDLDFFSVAVVAGHHHQVSCVGSAGGTCSVSVLTPAGTAIANGYSGVAFKPAAGLTSVVFQVSGSDGLRYSLTVTDAGADDHGDARADATALVIDATPVAGALETGADVDAFTISAGAGEIVSLNCVTTSGSACSVSVFTPTGTQVVSGTQNVASWRSGFLSAGGGSHLVQVRSTSYGTGSVGTYTLQATRGTDDFTTTTPFTLGTPRTGSLDYVGDTDVFTVALTQGVPVQMNITSGTRATVTAPNSSYGTTLYGGYTSTYTPTVTGTYVFTVATDSYYGVLTNYALSVQ